MAAGVYRHAQPNETIEVEERCIVAHSFGPLALFLWPLVVHHGKDQVTEEACSPQVNWEVQEGEGQEGHGPNWPGF